jgi:hypothetical protein
MEAQMRTSLFFAAALAAACLPASAMAAVTVTFSNRDHYTDAGPERGPEREHVLHELDAMFQEFGRRYLFTTDKLSIEVLDIDLAGRDEPWLPGVYGRRSDRRSATAYTGPRIALRYTLQTRNEPPATFEEIVSDRSYLDLPIGSVSHDRLSYERAMLERWFRDRFVYRQQVVKN